METRVQVLVEVTPQKLWSILNNAGDMARLSGALPPGVLGGPETGREEGVSLTRRWQDSQLEIRLEPVPQEGMPPATFTRVHVHHAHIPEGAMPAAFYREECWAAAWTLWLRNLKAWAERAEVPGLFDYSVTAPPVIERSMEMDAPPAQIWQAITDPVHRRAWMGEELGDILGRVEGRSVTFAFTPEPVPSQVTWTLEPLDSGARTRVHLRHDGLKRAYFDHDLGWHDYMVSLYQATARPLIRATDWIDASPERVWRYLSTEEGMRRWWNDAMTFEPFTGGTVRFEAYGGVLSGKVIAFEPGRKLAFSWTEEGEGWPEPEPLLLTLELAPEDGGTRVTLTHSGFENLPEAIRDRNWGGYRRGWAGRGSVAKLKAVIEADSRAA